MLQAKNQTNTNPLTSNQNGGNGPVWWRVMNDDDHEVITFRGLFPSIYENGEFYMMAEALYQTQLV